MKRRRFRESILKMKGLRYCDKLMILRNRKRDSCRARLFNGNRNLLPTTCTWRISAQLSLPYHTITRNVKKISTPIAMAILSTPLPLRPSDDTTVVIANGVELVRTSVAVVIGKTTVSRDVGLICTTVTIAVGGGFPTNDTTVRVVMVQILSRLSWSLHSVAPGPRDPSLTMTRSARTSMQQWKRRQAKSSALQNDDSCIVNLRHH